MCDPISLFKELRILARKSLKACFVMISGHDRGDPIWRLRGWWRRSRAGGGGPCPTPTAPKRCPRVSPDHSGRADHSGQATNAILFAFLWKNHFLIFACKSITIGEDIALFRSCQQLPCLGRRLLKVFIELTLRPSRALNLALCVASKARSSYWNSF